MIIKTRTEKRIFFVKSIIENVYTILMTQKGNGRFVFHPEEHYRSRESMDIQKEKGKVLNIGRI